MNADDFQRIERELDITLPPDFVQVMANLTGSEREAAFAGPFSILFMTADQLIRFNHMERSEDAATPCAFPNWWEKFVLIGTNGGGDYYCMRLDCSDQIVWMIGSDCGDEPSKINGSFEELVQENFEDYVEQKRKEAEIAQRRQPYEAEFDAHRAVIAQTDGSQDGIEWMECESGYRLMRMLDRIPRRPSPRKMRLFGIANCRLTDAIEEDADCREGLAVALKKTEGAVEDAAFMAMESRLRERVLLLEQGGGPSDSKTRRRRMWQTKAVHHLFQADNAYEVEAGIYPNDPDLKEAMNACSYALQNEPYGNDIQLHLLREVLGNPFCEILIDPRWKTEEVCLLARQMHQSDQFDRMPELAELLESAGCDDSRVIEHCRRPSGHVRGCWVVDQLLDLNEPSTSDPDWDFSCQHPRIDPQQLKTQMERFGSRGDLSRDDDDSREEFAAWLEDHGDPVWAEYIRVRSQLDDSPGDKYVDLLERSFELDNRMQSKMLQLDNLYFSGYRFSSEAWWDEEIDDYSFGLPFQILAVNPGGDPRPLDVFISMFNAVVERTPIRALNLDDAYASEFGPLLQSEGGKQLQWLAFENPPVGDQDEASPPIRDLVRSHTARNLRRLTAEHLVRSDADANALADAPFDNLRRVRVPYGKISCSPSALQKMMSGEGFANLEHWSASFDDQCGSEPLVCLSNLPKLHSLNLVRLTADQCLGFQQAQSFGELRRLRLDGADLTGDGGRSLGSARFPRLVELCLHQCKYEPKDLRNLLESPSFENLQLLTLNGPTMDDEIFQRLGEFPFASSLRGLRLRCGDENLVGRLSGLANSALTRDGGFPRLSSLEIKNPYRKSVTQDVAAFLEKLALPNLRHFALIDADIGDDAAEAMMGNATFSGITRLKLEMGYEASVKLSPKTAESLFRCPHFSRLLALEFNSFATGDPLKFLADDTVLPSLWSASIWRSRASKAIREQIGNARPEVYVGS